MISVITILCFYLQDKEEPDTVDRHLSNVPFDAKFADQEPNATKLTREPGSDGFVMNSAPLFEVRCWQNTITVLSSPGQPSLLTYLLFSQKIIEGANKNKCRWTLMTANARGWGPVHALCARRNEKLL